MSCVRRPADYGGSVPCEIDVDEGRKIRRTRTLQGRGEVGCRFNMFAVPAQRLDDTVVPRGEKLATHETLVSILAKLNLIFGVPCGVVTEHSYKGYVVTHSSIVLHDVESGGAVAEDGYDPRVGARQPRGKGERNRRSDGASGAVEYPSWGRDTGLRPLSPLSSVADEHRFRVFVKIVLDRRRDLI